MLFLCGYSWDQFSDWDRTSEMRTSHSRRMTTWQSNGLLVKRLVPRVNESENWPRYLWPLEMSPIA
jgi:hypothetical protein